MIVGGRLRFLSKHKSSEKKRALPSLAVDYQATSQPTIEQMRATQSEHQEGSNLNIRRALVAGGGKSVPDSRFPCAITDLQTGLRG